MFTFLISLHFFVSAATLKIECMWVMKKNMSKQTVQDLLQKFVDNDGEGVTSEEVASFLNDEDPLNKRIAHELMHNVTGDARYLVKCMAIIKDDVEALWEFLFDYTSELKDPYVITILMVEGLKYLDPIKDADKVEKIIYNWKIINPVCETLSSNLNTAFKIKNILELSLPSIATTFVNWILAGIKFKDYYEFDYFPYYLLNHVRLKYVFPDQVFKAIESMPEEHSVHFNKGILYVFQYDIESANKSFIMAAKASLKLNDVAQAYNILTLWYKSVGFILEKTPELLKDLHRAVYEIVEKAFELYADQPEIIIMTTYLYAEIAFALNKLNELDNETLMLLSSRFENKVRSYKSKYGITYEHQLKKKQKLNIAFVSQYMSKSSINSVTFDFIKYHDRDRFNVFFYDCGLNSSLSNAYREEFSKYSTIRSYEDKYKGDKIKNILELSDIMKDDSIDIVIYTDWLYNIIGHFLCSLQPAPLIISSKFDFVSTGLKSVPYVFDYLGICSSRVFANQEQLIKVPLLFADLYEKQLPASREIYEIPDQSVLLYSSNYLKNVADTTFINIISSILEQNPGAHFAFSGPGDPDQALGSFDDKGLSERATYLGDITTPKSLMSFIKMSDVYLNTISDSNVSELYSAMVASKPVLTMIGDDNNFNAKLGQHIVSLESCIAKSHEDYVEMVTAFINSKDLRVETGNALKERYNRELEFKGALKEIEGTLFRLYENLCN